MKLEDYGNWIHLSYYEGSKRIKDLWVKWEHFEHDHTIYMDFMANTDPKRLSFVDLYLHGQGFVNRLGISERPHYQVRDKLKRDVDRVACN